MIVQTTALGNPIIDTKGELWGFSLQNNDPANDVYVLDERTGLDKSGTAAVPPRAIKIAANGGSWTREFYCGKLYAVAMNSPVDLAAIIDRKQWLAQLLAALQALIKRAA